MIFIFILLIVTYLSEATSTIFIMLQYIRIEINVYSVFNLPRFPQKQYRCKLKIENK